MDSSAFHVGDTIDGKYRIEGILGSGAMGLVVRARHAMIGHEVAIKLPLAEMRAHPDLTQRAIREARAAAHLESEHVCRVLDVGLVDGLPYIVMELLDGTSVARVAVARGGVLEPTTAAAIIVDACDALGEAHEKGIVHRDVKPHNLFLAKRGKKTVLKVVDFGISKLGDTLLLRGDPSLTAASGVMGSPAYMAPEQIASTKTVDARADVWALGVCLFQLVTGRLPFSGSRLVDIAVRVATETVPAPSSITERVPTSLDKVILRCLDHDREARYANARELATALREAVPLRGDELDELAPAIDSERELAGVELASTVDAGDDHAAHAVDAAPALGRHAVIASDALSTIPDRVETTPASDEPPSHLPPLVAATDRAPAPAPTAAPASVASSPPAAAPTAAAAPEPASPNAPTSATKRRAARVVAPALALVGAALAIAVSVRAARRSEDSSPAERATSVATAATTTSLASAVTGAPLQASTEPSPRPLDGAATSMQAAPSSSSSGAPLVASGKAPARGGKTTATGTARARTNAAPPAPTANAAPPAPTANAAPTTTSELPNVR